MFIYWKESFWRVVHGVTFRTAERQRAVQTLNQWKELKQPQTLAQLVFVELLVITESLVYDLCLKTIQTVLFLTCRKLIVVLYSL